MVFPRMFRVKQRFEGPMLHDIPAAIRETMRGLHLQDKVKPGESVAVTAGSRGIANIDRITRAVVDALGAYPVVNSSLDLENKIRIIVFNLKREGNIVRAVRGESIGTVVSSQTPDAVRTHANN